MFNLGAVPNENDALDTVPYTVLYCTVLAQYLWSGDGFFLDGFHSCKGLIPLRIIDEKVIFK